MATRPSIENEAGPRVAGMRAELERVRNSNAFAKSHRLCLLLTYICENSMQGRLDELTEQQIGINVFGRTPGFNSADDAIVRGTARHLRERLALYYQEEGKNDPLQIIVPKGGYLAHFERMPQGSAVSPVEKAATLIQNSTWAEPVPASAKTKTKPLTPWPWQARFAVATCVLLVLALSTLVYFLSRPSAKPSQESFGPAILWRALFTTGRKTLIVPGDASLDAYVAWEQRPVSLAEYTNQSYQQDVTVSKPPSHLDVPLSVRSVTPMADLRLVSQLVRIPELLGEPQLADWTGISYARDLVVSETHDNNLILIGAETFNPWVTLYQPLLDFDVHWDYKSDIYTVTNRAPHRGEQESYVYDRHTPGLKAYTLVALLDNSQGRGRVLLIEGTSMGTTYGAMNFFTNDSLWGPVMRAAVDKSGRLHNFEVLLSDDFIRGGVSNTQIVALHVH
jgi:hypothetical protein